MAMIISPIQETYHYNDANKTLRDDRFEVTLENGERLINSSSDSMNGEINCYLKNKYNVIQETSSCENNNHSNLTLTEEFSNKHQESSVIATDSTGSPTTNDIKSSTCNCSIMKPCKTDIKTIYVACGDKDSNNGVCIQCSKSFDCTDQYPEVSQKSGVIITDDSAQLSEEQPVSSKQSPVLQQRPSSLYTVLHSNSEPKDNSILVPAHSSKQRSHSGILRSKTLDEDVKSRRLSTPEMLNRQKAHRRKSVQSMEHLKSMRANVVQRKTFIFDSNNRHITGSSQESEGFPNTISSSNGSISGSGSNENNNTSPFAKQRKLSNIFRKISSTKQLDRRSLNITTADDTLGDRKQKSGKNSAVDLRTEYELVVGERDQAIEEWSESAKKCEELINELEETLSQLILVKNERDQKHREVEHLLVFYETDIDERERELKDLYTKLQDMSEVLAVTRTERSEAYDRCDKLLQETYKYKQEVEKLGEKLHASQRQCRELQQNCKIMEQQLMVFKKNDRDSALELCNTIEEESHVHEENQQTSTTNEQDEITALKRERDQLRDELNKLKKVPQHYGGEQNENEINGQTHLPLPHNNTDSGFESGTPPNIKSVNSVLKEDDDQIERNINTSCACEDNVNEDLGSPHFTKASSNIEENEDIAICIDTLDSRTGLKFENAFDTPRVMVTEVTSQLEEKWNIRKYDRIVSVNGTCVQNAEKKVVDKLIKDTIGRTITLVLRREKPTTIDTNHHSDVEINLGKQLLGIGLLYSLKVESIDEQETDGIENITVGDVITKINSQDVNSIINSLVRKLAKKSNNRITLRVKKGDDNEVPQSPKSKKQVVSLRSQSLPHMPRKKAQQSSLTNTPTTETTRNVLSDISSLFSFVSINQTNKTNNTESTTTCTSPKPHPANHKLVKQKSFNLPTINIEQPKAENDRKLYSPILSQSFESFTQVFLSPEINNDAKGSTIGTLSPRNNNNVLITPPRRNSLYRQSPRIRHIDDVIEKRTSRSRSLYLEALHRQSLNPSPSLETSQDQSQLTDTSRASDVAPKTLTFRNIAGYATLPRRYRRNKTKDKQPNNRTIRLNKDEADDPGFQICGGNRVGIFVQDVKEGSIAQTAGLKIGDRLLQLNSIDLTRATLDFATRVVLSNRKRTKIRLQVEYTENYMDVLDISRLESIYVRCLHSYNAVNLNEMSFKTGDILHITDTRYNYDAENLTWTWYGVKKVSASKQCEGEIPAIETYKDPATKDSYLEQDTAQPTLAPSRFRRFSKWFTKRPLLNRRTPSRTEGEKTINENSKRFSFYEVLLEEPIRIS